MNIQHLLRKIIERDYKQDELAIFCSCSQATISQILNGRIKNPSYQIGSRIVDFARGKGIISGDRP